MIGIALIAVEVFVIPGFGVAGISGLLMVVGSLIFSMLDGVKWHTYQWGGSGGSDLLDALGNPAQNLAIGIFGSLGLFFLMMKYLPRLKFIGDTMLPGSLERGNGSEGDHTSDRVGMTGVAVSNLRPSGKAEIDGEVVEVLSEGVFISKGEGVRIVSEDGMGITVKKSSS